MKLEITEKDKNLLNLLNSTGDLDGNFGGIPHLVTKRDEPYMLEFKVTDSAKASLFIESIFYNLFEGFDLEKDAGIHVTSLDFKHPSNQFIEDLEKLINKYKISMRSKE